MCKGQFALRKGALRHILPHAVGLWEARSECIPPLVAYPAEVCRSIACVEELEGTDTLQVGHIVGRFEGYCRGVARGIEQEARKEVLMLTVGEYGARRPPLRAQSDSRAKLCHLR